MIKSESFQQLELNNHLSCLSSYIISKTCPTWIMKYVWNAIICSTLMEQPIVELFPIFVFKLMILISATKKGTRGSVDPPEGPKFVIRRSQIIF